MKAFYVYMMTNRSRVVLYTGITNSLMRRVSQHQNGEIKGFTKTYNVNLLVYYERFNDPRDAIAREKEIKGWRAQKRKTSIGRDNESELGGFISPLRKSFVRSNPRERSLAPLGMTKENI